MSMRRRCVSLGLRPNWETGSQYQTEMGLSLDTAEMLIENGGVRVIALSPHPPGSREDRWTTRKSHAIRVALALQQSRKLSPGLQLH